MMRASHPRVPGTRAAHLTDAELTRLLDGAEPDPRAAAHLGVCLLCREELEAVQASLGSFRVLTAAWAEAEAPRRVPTPARWLRGLRLQTSWGAGLAATAITGLLAFWLGVPGQPDAAGSRNVTTHALAATPSHATLAADDKLLLSIDHELTEPGSPELSAEQLGLADGQGSTHQVTAVTD